MGICRTLYSIEVVTGSSTSQVSLSKWSLRWAEVKWNTNHPLPLCGEVGKWATKFWSFIWRNLWKAQHMLSLRGTCEGKENICYCRRLVDVFLKKNLLYYLWSWLCPNDNDVSFPKIYKLLQKVSAFNADSYLLKKNSVFCISRALWFWTFFKCTKSLIVFKIPNGHREYINILYLFGGSRVWTQGFTIAKQLFCPLFITSSPLCSGYFWKALIL
jgi:hypothetical protein